jgi:hypothetical protein
MADINARTRLLVGTTADWAGHDLVLGAGELVLERAGSVIKMKAGDGAAKFSALPYVTATPTIPPEYMDQTETDARYLQLADVVTTATASKVPRLNTAGMLNSAMIPLPPAIDVSVGAADAGKLVKTNSTGKVDPTMIAFVVGGYKGTADGTALLPPGVYLAGDYFSNTGTGPAHASWGLAAGTVLTPTQQLIFDAVKWSVVGLGTGSIVRLPDGTAPAPSLAFINEPTTGLYRPGADILGFSTSGVERLRVSAALTTLTSTQLLVNSTQQVLLNSPNVLINGAAYGTLGVRKGGAYGGAVPNSAYDGLVIESDSNTGISILTPGTMQGAIAFGDEGGNTWGRVSYAHSIDTMAFIVANTARLSLTDKLATFGTGVQIATSAGTAAAPSHSFSTVLDMGMFRAASNTLAFATVGVEKMRITGSLDAEFLVGETVPKYSTTGRGIIEVNGSNESNYGLVVNGVAQSFWNATPAAQNQINFGSASTRPLVFFTNSLERGRFHPGGGFRSYGSIEAQQFSTSAPPELIFYNRGNGADTFSFDASAVWASAYRDVLDPAFIAGIVFRRDAAAGGLASAGNILFKTSTTGEAKGTMPEIMRVTGSGSLRIGTIASNGANDNRVTVMHASNAQEGIRVVSSAAGSLASITTNRSDTTGNTMTFQIGGGATCGSISHPTASSTAYNTTSDERLKENVAPSDVDFGATIDAIEVVKFDWIVDGVHVRASFIAQDLVVPWPEAVKVGGEDVQQDPWGIDPGRLVPLLVGELQSLRRRIAALEPPAPAPSPEPAPAPARTRKETRPHA